MRELAQDTSADRREFLNLLGASFALAGASGRLYDTLSRALVGYG